MILSASDSSDFNPVCISSNLLNPSETALASSYGLQEFVNSDRSNPVGSNFEQISEQPLLDNSSTSNKDPLYSQQVFNSSVSSHIDPALQDHITCNHPRPDSPNSDSGFPSSISQGSKLQLAERDSLLAPIGSFDQGSAKSNSLLENSQSESDESYPQDGIANSVSLESKLVDTPTLLPVNPEDFLIINDVLGDSISESYRVGDGSVQDFERGQLLASDYGTFPVFGGIGHEYINYNGSAEGRLGFPISYEEGLGNGVIIQRFENGKILYGDGATRTLMGGQELAVGLDGGDSVNTTYTDTYKRAGGWEELGSAINPVHPWEDGYVQDFKGGTDRQGAIMKSNENNKSFWVGGTHWLGYLKVGGAGGSLGYPVSDEYAAGDSVTAQDFQKGTLFSSPDGTFPVFGGIGYEYLVFNGGAEGRLGHPISKEEGLGNGAIIQRFENGEILYGDGATRTRIGGQELAVGLDGGDSVNTTYTDTFIRAGGYNIIGSAINPVHPWDDGYVQDFSGGSDERGAIMKSNASNDSFWVGGKFWTGYLEAGGAGGVLRYPTSNRYSAGSGLAQDFKGGTLYSSDHGIFLVFGGIRDVYSRENGGAEGRLGHPISKEEGLGNGVIIQRFENGEIIYGDGGATRTLTGGQELAIGLDGGNKVNTTYTGTHSRVGGWNTAGSPINDVHPWANGYVQDFSGGSDERGAIMKSNKNNKSFWVGGDTWQQYLKAGGAEGILGYPTSDKKEVSTGASRQDFEDGAIYQTNKGTFALYGGVGEYYLSQIGAERSALGLPESGEVGIGNGVIRQNFEKGYILWKKGATAYKYDGSHLFPSSPSNPTSSKGAISYQTYLNWLYRDNDGGAITQNYEQHKANNKGAIDSADNDADRKVYSLTNGEIKYVGKDQNGGNFIKVWNPETRRNFIYLHFSKFNSGLKNGQTISKGDYLGFEGQTGRATGIHTHVHVTKADNISRENPLEVLGQLYGSSEPAEQIANDNPNRDQPNVEVSYGSEEGWDEVDSSGIIDKRNERDNDFNDKTPDSSWRYILNAAESAHYQSAQAWEDSGWDEAAYMLRLYLDGEIGQSLYGHSIDLDKMLSESPSVQRVFEKQFRDNAIDKVKREITKGFTYGKVRSDWAITGQSQILGRDTDINWKLAVGGFHHRYEATWEVAPNTNNKFVNFEVTFYLADNYDFEEYPNKDTERLIFSHELHLNGLARAYLVEGVSKTYNESIPIA